MHLARACSLAAKDKCRRYPSSSLTWMDTRILLATSAGSNLGLISLSHTWHCLQKKLLTSTPRRGQLVDLISPRPSSPLLSLTHESYAFNCTCIFLFFEESSSDALQLTSILSPYGRSQFSIITGHPGEVVPAKAPLFQLISPLWSGTSKVVLINTYLVPP